MISLGLAGGLGPDLVARLAPAAEAAGFARLWINDTPDGDALAALAAAAGATTRIGLATGVIPVDRRPAAAIATDAAGLPAERLVLGIGSGAARHGALDRVADAIEVLRAGTSARIVVGALGPRMRALGAERADGVVLNWLPAETAAVQTRALHDRSPAAHAALYVRTAVDPGARARLEAETARYASIPNYAANFARLGVAASDTVLPDTAAVARILPDYVAAVDEVVLRAIVADDTEAAYRAFIDATAPAGRPRD